MDYMNKHFGYIKKGVVYIDWQKVSEKYNGVAFIPNFHIEIVFNVIHLTF